MKPSELIKLAVNTTAQNTSCGIYMIYNIKSDKAYIGHSTKIKLRWRKHRQRLRYKYHVNEYLQNAWVSTGEQFFTFLILEECPIDYEILKERESFWLEQLNEDCRYNLAAIMASGPISEETRYKLKTRVFTPEHRARISASKKGISTGKQSDETKRKRSEALSGRKRPPRSEEWCRKLSEGRKRNTKLQQATLADDL